MKNSGKCESNCENCLALETTPSELSNLSSIRPLETGTMANGLLVPSDWNIARLVYRKARPGGDFRAEALIVYREDTHELDSDTGVLILRVKNFSHCITTCRHSEFKKKFVEISFFESCLCIHV